MTRERASNAVREWLPWITVAGFVVNLTAVLTVGYSNYSLLRYRVEQLEKALNNGVRQEVREVRDYVERVSDRLHAHIEERGTPKGGE